VEVLDWAWSSCKTVRRVVSRSTLASMMVA